VLLSSALIGGEGVFQDLFTEIVSGLLPRDYCTTPRLIQSMLVPPKTLQ